MNRRYSSSELFQKIYCKFKTFCEYCTLHGMYHFYQASQSWLYFIWSIIIGCSLCLSAYLSYMIWWKYVNNPTFTIVESTHYSIESISVPAITLCDSETIYFPNTDNVTWFLSLRGYDQKKIQMFYKSFTDIKLYRNASERYLPNMHNFLSEMGYSYDTLLDKLTKPCRFIVRECVWRAKKFECSKLFRKVFTMMGYCCQFDVNYFREQVKGDLNFNCGVELSEGLDMIVNTQTTLYNESLVDSYLNMYVSDNHSKLTLLDSPIVLTEKYFFDITLAVWAIDSSEDVKRLSLKNRKCFLSEDTPEGANSFQNCIMFNILENVTAQCRCLPFNYEPPEIEGNDFENCSWVQLKCVYNMLDYIQSDLKYRILEQGCYQKCDHVQYDTEVTSLKIDKNVDNLQRGESRVVVHFADNTCMKYRREVLFTWDQMLGSFIEIETYKIFAANLGGIFGLCLGGSIVSIIELIWFLVELLHIVIRFKQKNLIRKTNTKKTYF